MTVAQEVVGYRACKDRMRGSAWWTDEIKGTVEEKKKAYKNMLQECIKRSKCEKEQIQGMEKESERVSELVDESKIRIDEEFGRKFSERFMENRKLLERGEEREEM